MKNQVCEKCATTFNPQTVDGCPKCKQTEEKMSPLRLGHFKQLVSQKQAENESLGETRDALADNVRSLWKMIALLQQRKAQLEVWIIEMEKYLKKGSDIIDDFDFESSDIMPLTEKN